MKNTQKHTPGPWSVATYGCSPDFFAIKIGSFSLATKIPNEQDARLIAAAPDLLVALKQCVPLIVAHANYSGEGVGTLQVVRAAIAKTEGNA